jgi:hypothetical protein
MKLQSPSSSISSSLFTATRSQSERAVMCIPAKQVTHFNNSFVLHFFRWTPTRTLRETTSLFLSSSTWTRRPWTAWAVCRHFQCTSLLATTVGTTTTLRGAYASLGSSPTSVRTGHLKGSGGSQSRTPSRTRKDACSTSACAPFSGAPKTLPGLDSTSLTPLAYLVAACRCRSASLRISEKQA